MAERRPKPLSASERGARWRRLSRIARRLGFVGRIEYRHIYSQAGGAQFGLGSSPDQDLLIVFAEAFERDADPEDFSLDAIIAHERGHQLLARHEKLTRNLPLGWSLVSEEIVASLLGSLLVPDTKDREALVLKAIFQAESHGIKAEMAAQFVLELRTLLEKTI